MAKFAINSRLYEKANRTLEGSTGEDFGSEKAQRSKNYAVMPKPVEIIQIFAHGCGA